MFESIVTIVSQYSSAQITRHTITHVEAVRRDVEDVFYLIQNANTWYVFYETDFIDNLPDIVTEAQEVFGHDFTLLHWLLKVSGHDSNPRTLDFNSSEIHRDNPPYDTLVYQQPNSYLKFVAIEVKPKFKPHSPSHPTAYGGSK